MTRPRRRSDGWARLGWGLVVAVILLSLAPAAAAQTTNPLAGGTTTLHLKRGFLAELAAREVHLSAGGGLDDPGRALALAVVGGALDPVDGKGLIEQDGVLRLRHNRLHVAITEINADTASGIVRAQVAGATMKLGFLAGQSSERAGFGVNVKATALKLSAKAARRLSHRLGLDPAAGLTPGRPLSNLYSATQPRTVAVAPSPPASSYPVLLGSGPLDSATGKMFARGLVPLGISPAYAHYPQSMQWPPMDVILFFPVDAGSVAPDASAGTLALGGGVRILMPTNGATVDRTSITLDLGAGAMANPGGPILALDGSEARVRSDPVERTIYVEGIETGLSEPFAAQLNRTFDPFLPAPLPATGLQPGESMGSINLFLEAR